ncbi:C-3',4' desaturase CrtD [Salsuginibacillus halophilus]|uniref:C-3',4' desaturase CrtD n=1 Tax=Salsuginibacillus halophilus TaxID=517424 RepID=A0A2P8HX81_9BACI|nr:NAD(P)/FAD-dependent oxidoreductase [Salsuginibacillus halophilus]PSL50794.1 C-3',4' desaturase CrtD [Salsuginibacillus halophilus]
MKFDTVVIGAGIGGLTCASLLTKTGRSVGLFEASGALGGCAGAFSRGAFAYPVGATLGLGFQPNGVHQRLMHVLGREIQSFPVDPVMEVKHPHFTIQVKADREAHVQNLQAYFPEISSGIASFYAYVFQIGSTIKQMMQHFPRFPMKNMEDVKRWLRGSSWKTRKLVPLLSQTVYSVLKHHGALDPDFIDYLDGQLIDSMQTDTRHCSALFGLYALDVYHSGSHYVYGGLSQIAETLGDVIESGGNSIYKHEPVHSVTKSRDGFTLQTEDGRSIQARQVILNVPVQSLCDLLDAALFTKLTVKWRQKASQAIWSSCTMYGAIDETYLRNTSLYTQHITVPGGKTNGEHFFLSISSRDDETRAPAGLRSFTISTHTNPRSWIENNDQKSQIEETIYTQLQAKQPEVYEGIQHAFSASPKTWEAFTRRPSGMVGGFPVTRSEAVRGALSVQTPVKGLYMCGDSVFPGASTMGVTYSGIHAFEAVTGLSFTAMEELLYDL